MKNFYLKSMQAFACMIFLLIISSAGCHKEEIRKGNFELGDTVVIRISQLLENKENNIRIRMDSVLNDSRCPLGVECIWAGNATVQFLFSSQINEIGFKLNTTLSPKDTLINGYRISLVSLLPYPVWKHPFPYKEYSAKITVKKE